MDNKAIIWRAVSSAAQAKADKKSLDDQLSACEEYCKKHNLHAAHCLTSTQTRSSKSSNPLYESKNSAYVELIELCESRSCVAYVVDRPDRIARDYLWAEQVVRLCLNNSVAVHIVSTGEIIASWDQDPLRRIVSAYSATQAVRTTVAVSIRGRLRRNEQGLFPNKIPYGYAEEYDRKGDWLKYADVKSEQSIVLQIYELFLSGHGQRPISDIVNSEGGRLSKTQIKRILYNVWVYAGYTIFFRSRERDNRQSYPVPLDKNPNAIINRGRHRPIIDEEYARKIEAEIIRRGKNTAIAKRKYLFSGMIYCGGCENRMAAARYVSAAGTEGLQFRCDTQGCEFYRKGVNNKKVLPAVLEELEEQQLRVIDLLKTQQDVPRQQQTTENRRESIQKQISSEDQKLLRISRKFAETGNDEIFDKLYDEITQRKKQLEKELDELPDEQPPPTADEQYRTIAQIKYLLMEAPPKETNSLIRDIVKVVVCPKTKALQVALELH